MSPLAANAVEASMQEVLQRLEQETAATKAETAVAQVMPYPLANPWSGRILELTLKRLMDIIGSIAGLVLFLPIMVVVAIAIKLESPGPVLFKQKRVGKDGVEFEFWKFRSMVIGADEMKDKLIALNEKDGPIFKIKNDPRVTRVGRFIRKYSIDELPQLFHVLTAKMSIVGPRPPLPSEVMNYGRYEWTRLSVQPGLTCLWQISGRSNLGFDEWMKLDIQYISNWSILLDLQIIAKTFWVVIKSEGAY
ncbi:MAG: sugar transferase [Bacteroidota bacterium]